MSKEIEELKANIDYLRQENARLKAELKKDRESVLRATKGVIGALLVDYAIHVLRWKGIHVTKEDVETLESDKEEDANDLIEAMIKDLLPF